MLGLDVRKRSRVFALSLARSGTRVGSEITCVKSLTMAKASASRPARLVTLEEKVTKSELWRLKSPRTMLSERGDCSDGFNWFGKVVEKKLMIV